MLTTGRPATIPANTTTPSPAARTGAPGAAARSTPRCPAAYGPGGGSKERVTTGAPSTGATQGATAAGTVGAAAAGAGVMVFAGMVAGRPVVSIDHADGLRTTYEPVTPSVGAGRRVSRGSPIGTLAAGHAGCPGSACLHWGLRRGENYLDPLDLLRPPRVRLLTPGSAP